MLRVSLTAAELHTLAAAAIERDAIAAEGDGRYAAAQTLAVARLHRSAEFPARRLDKLSKVGSIAAGMSFVPTLQIRVPDGAPAHPKKPVPQ